MLNRKIGLLVRFFILFLFFSCKNDFNEDSYKKTLTFSIDTISININDYQLFDYTYYSIYETDSLAYFYGYNQPLHSIDKFSLKGEKFLKSIPLNPDGPNSVDIPFDFYVHNEDSIFYYGSNYSLDIIDESGVIINSNLLESTRNFTKLAEQNVGFLAHPIYHKLYFDSKINSVFFHSYSVESIPNNSKYYQTPILVEINLETAEVIDYPFYFPNPYQKEGEYLGEYMNPNIVVEDSLIIFSFPNSPVINVYDRKLDKLVSKEIKSRFTKNSVEPLPSETYSEIHLRLNHLIENPYFFRTLFDPYKNLYYRIHRGEHPNPDLSLGNYNLSYTRDYLSVFDSDFNLLEEIELPAKTYNALLFFVTNEGLNLPYSHYLNPNLDENKLVFHTYKFKLE